MEEKKNMDAIESLFQKSFEQLGAFPEEKVWNVPSDEVWTNIQSRMAESEAKRIRPIWWWAAASMIGLLFIGGLSQHFYYKEQLHLLSDQLKSNEQRVEQMQDQLANIQVTEQPVVVSQVAINEADTPLSTEASTSPLAKASNNNYSSNTATANTASVQSSPVADLQVAGLPVQFIADQESIAEMNTSAVNHDNVVHSFVHQGLNADRLVGKQELQPLALNRLNIKEISSSSEHLPQSALAPIVRLNQKPKNQFYVGASAGPFWTTKPDHPIEIPGLEAKEVERAYRAGVQLGIPINSNWSIETGINYVASSVDVQYPQSVAFASGNEQVNSNGMYESSYDLLVPSSVGNVTTDISLSRTPNTSIEDGERINVALNLAFKSQQLEVPVIGKYQVNLGPVALTCLLYTSPSPRDRTRSRMPSSA